MYIIDCGLRQATIYNSDTDEVKTISHEDILRLPEQLPFGSTVVSEYAHLGCPRTEKSLAQVFTADELLNLYQDFEDHHITLRLFPQQSTARACNYSRLEKSDENDPKSLYILLKDFPEISLMHPPQTFDVLKTRKESYEWVDKNNACLNVARRYQYADEEDANYKFIVENAERLESMLSETAKSAFRFEKYKVSNKTRGYKAGDINIKKLKLPQIYSVLVNLQDYEGNLRIRRTGRLAGWKFIKRYALKMTPFHLKGGVARSNLYYHGLRHWVAEKASEELGTSAKSFKKKRRGGYTNEEGKYIEPFTKQEDELYRKYRTKYCNAVKELYLAMKEIIQEDTGFNSISYST